MERRKFIRNSSLLSAGIVSGVAQANLFDAYKDTIIGHNSYQYKIDLQWGALNSNFYPVNDCHEMVQDSQGRILLLTNHTKNNVIVYDRSGKLLEVWGTDYPGAHGLTLNVENGEDMLYIADNNRHEVIKTDLKGQVVQVFTYPKESGNYKTKEREVVNSIRKVYPDFTWVADKKVADGCSRRRPDLLLDLGTHIVIIEIDENKHDSYDCSCENMRVMEISRDVGHRPIVFIRFNPDGYTSSQTGKKISSCWRLNKLGVMSIVKTKQHEWDERMNTLMLQIQYWNDNPPTKMIETVQLYY